MLRTVIFLSIIFATQSLKEERELKVGECLTELVTDGLTTSYNLLQLSSIFGSTQAYPGFASFYTKLSDEISSKSHDLTKMIAMKHFPVNRLIRTSGIQVKQTLGEGEKMSIRQGLEHARNVSNVSWLQTRKCHEIASTKADAFVQDYLEEHHLDHHVKTDKKLFDLEKRILAATETERPLIIYMIDEELLHSYGDRRKNVFS